MKSLARYSLRTLVSLSVLALPTAAFAQVVYVVDDDGGAGVSFTDIQSAVDVAGPQDRIDVRDGIYGDVVIGGPVTIMGLTADPGLVRVGRVQVSPIMTLQDVVLSKMRPVSVEATGIAGTLLLDRLQTQALVFTGCGDVRLQNSTVNVQTVSLAGFAVAGVSQTDSQLFVSASQVIGARGRDGFVSGSPGGAAIQSQGRCDLVVTGSTLEGGAGGVASFGFSNQTFGERGGYGIETVGGDLRAIVMDSALVGGDAGDDNGGGNDGPGASVAGCTPGTELTLCRTTTSGASPSPACAAATTIDDGYPSILLIGGNTPGQSGSIEFRGRAGASARVLQGRNFAFAPSPFGFVPRLVSVDRTSSVGPFAAGAPTTWNYTTSPFARGSRFHFQIAQPGSTSGLDWSSAMTILID